MKKFLLILIPFSAFSQGYVAGPEFPTVFSRKDKCEEISEKTCFLKGEEDHTLTKIEKIEVDDPEKPIYEFSEAKEECVEQSLEDKEAKVVFSVLLEPECQMVCEKDFELFEEKRCRKIIGFEKKEVDSMVLDEVKVSAREAEEEAYRLAQEAIRAEEARIEAERQALKLKLESEDPVSAEDIKAALKLLL